jgi:nucleoside-diphosphate-sugar epimerase
MTKKILIIGCEGYLGSRLSDYLINKKKYYVEGIDVGYFKNCNIYRAKFFKIKKKNAKKITKQDIKNFDVVIQLAAFSNDPLDRLKPKEFYKPTRDYTVKIAKICKTLNKKFIFPSSCSVYGYGKILFKENSKTNPITFYSKNKLEIEKDLKKLENKSFKPIILRLSTVFGMSPRLRFDVVINMLCGMAFTKKKIILNSNGLAWRPHVYIDDVCDVIEYFVNVNISQHRKILFNVGQNINNCKVIDVVKIIKKYLPNTVVEFANKKNIDIKEIFLDKKIKDGIDKRSYRVSFHKLKRIFPAALIKHSLDKGIKRFIQDLKLLRISKEIFESKKFYRLQKLGEIKEKFPERFK